MAKDIPLISPLRLHLYHLQLAVRLKQHSKITKDTKSMSPLRLHLLKLAHISKHRFKLLLTQAAIFQYQTKVFTRHKGNTCNSFLLSRMVLRPLNLLRHLIRSGTTLSIERSCLPSKELFTPANSHNQRLKPSLTIM